MTTAGSNGTPEGAAEDDPFAYLYRPANGEATPHQARSPIARPMEVGRAQYGQQARQGQPPQQFGGPPPAAGYGAPSGETPPQQSRYAERSRPRPGQDTGGGRGRAAVIGAVAVIAAIAIGAGIALSGGGKKGTTADHTTTPSAPASSGHPTGSDSPSASASPTVSTNPIADATTLQAQNAPQGNSIKGAVSADGSYVTLQAGSSVTWTISVPTADKYHLWFHYDNPGGDVPAVVTVNGQPHPGGVTLKNYTHASDPAQAWSSTNIWPQLQAGPNTITLSVPAGSSVSIPLDQVAITPMNVTDYPKH